MNIPNILTAIRLVLVPVFIIVFFSNIPHAILISIIIFLSAGLTDVLDGYIARKYDMITKWGSVLDPLADKLMSITVLLSLTIRRIIPIWVLVIIGIKEALMIIGGAILFNKGTFVPARVYGKVATVIFYVAIFTLGFNRHMGLYLIYITVFAALFAFYKYIENYIRFTQGREIK